MPGAAAIAEAEPSFASLTIRQRPDLLFEVMSEWDATDGRLPVMVPKGFVTDLTSVPRIFWWFLPKTGFYLGAAVGHDHLYSEQQVSRARADRWFFTIGVVDGESLFKMWIMWLALRIGGRRAWKKRAQAA